MPNVPFPGAIFDLEQVKLVILFVLMTADVPMEGRVLHNIVRDGDSISHFDFCECIDNLLERGVIDILRGTTVESPSYIVTSTGKEVYTTLRTRLPYSTRERYSAYLLKAQAEERHNREVLTEIRGDGTTKIVNCKIVDEQDVLLEINLFVPNVILANRISDRFKAYTDKIYQTIIDVMTEED